MGCCAVGISVSSALFSGITFLGAPGYSFQHGMAMAFQLCGFYVAIPTVSRFVVPIFLNLKLTSAYEILEIRFDLTIRLIASGLFILRMLFYLAIVLYAPALALSTITPLPIWLCILSAGLLSAGYTVSGGMRAVIWTDFFQFFVLWGGCLVLVLFAAGYTEGGFAAGWEMAFSKNGGLSLGPDLGADGNVWTAVVGGMGLIFIQELSLSLLLS